MDLRWFFLGPMGTNGSQWLLEGINMSNTDTVTIAIDGMVPAQPLGPMFFSMVFFVSQLFVTTFFNVFSHWANGTIYSLLSASAVFAIYGQPPTVGGYVRNG